MNACWDCSVLPFQPAILKQTLFSQETADMLQLISSLYLPRGQCIWSCISSMQWLYTTCLKTYVGAVTVVFFAFFGYPAGSLDLTLSVVMHF